MGQEVAERRPLCLFDSTTFPQPSGVFGVPPATLPLGWVPRATRNSELRANHSYKKQNFVFRLFTHLLVGVVDVGVDVRANTLEQGVEVRSQQRLADAPATDRPRDSVDVAATNREGHEVEGVFQGELIF